ncbi:efflux RND transporter periplasmic adaptor subunit [Sulfurovum sp. zt1-1]|uniref:Efflux RND transporter periplasmic adaptor subunit n=1 Tax=Sulfurovum zhangzhouensis TaxID=3019067 RepID=A0ABT7QVW1_9BACT|nr:efflux RND transporter periplasmic adaptor subunit [Sulfurovum zhangzhouensis]MDM5270922.1 efflux RND transporter periplasmic adaptor subunit [Sulfurovum zhangzhouensis]
MKKLLISMIMMATAIYAEEVYATFQVEADKSAELAFSSSGIVNKVHIDVGSIVKKDDVLASLENSDLKAMLESAQAAEKYAKKDFDRQQKVKQVIDQAQFDQYAYKYENAKAQAAYQKALFEKTVLKAPFDGVIFKKMVEEGDVVSGAMIRTILMIQSLHERKLILTFDQKYHATVKVGDLFKYKVDGDDNLYEGKIIKIYPALDIDKRKVIAEVEAKDLMVGLFGEGMIITNEK